MGIECVTLMFDILTSYNFIIAALGAIILGISAGAIGTISVLKGQSLIGDAIGHSAFPGIVIIFMIFQTRNPLMLLLGAFISGTVAYFFIECISKNSKIKKDTSLAIVLSCMFGFGMMLKSFISGNPQFTKTTQSGLMNYIYGQAALILEKDILIIFVIGFVSLILFFIFYKEIKLYIFDSLFARTSNFKPRLISSIVLVMTMSIIAVGLKTVGAILISSLLITPSVIGLQCSDKFKNVIFIAMSVGGISGFLGTLISSGKLGFPNGPSIILVMAFFAILSMIFGRKGIIRTYVRRGK